MSQGFSRVSLAVAGALFAVFIATTLVRMNPPPPAPKWVPETRFSAERAIADLADILGNGDPHPIGSPANRAVRNRIIGHLEALGLDPFLQREFVCGPYGTCGTVENIVTRIFGNGGGRRAVLLSVHYDSVPAGPGASDDGAAVASAIEIARALEKGPKLKNDVIILIDDGEEAGLLGAEAFASAHPWAADVGADVNLEARGTAGRSFMFETSEDNQWLVDLASRAVPSPSTSSLFYSIYQRLPNDTDFTVFKRFGMSGVNFAFIGGVSRYHTPLDDLAHVDPSSVQHQGESALAMVRALGNANLDEHSRDTDSWFDVFGWFVVHWPEQWNPLLAILGLALAAGCSWLAKKHYSIRLSEIGRAVTWWIVVWVATILVAHFLVSTLRATGAIDSAWPLHDAAGIAGLWIFALAFPVFLWAVSGDWFSGKALWCGGMLWISVLGVITSFLMPGVSYLFIVPALGGSLVALAGLRFRVDSLVLAPPVALIGVTTFPIAAGIWSGLGATSSGVIVAFACLASLLLLSGALDFPTRKLGAAAAIVAGLALGLVAGAFASPAFSINHPRRVNVSLLEDARHGIAYWMVPGRRSTLPFTMREAEPWIDGVVQPFPWLRSAPRYAAAPARMVPVPSPELQLVATRNEARGRVLTLRLRSPRGAQTAMIVLHDLAAVRSITVGGQRFDLAWANPRGRIRSPYGRIGIETIPPEGVELRVAMRGTNPLDLTLLDVSRGVPAEGDALINSRPAWASPSDGGDAMIVRRSMTF